MKAQNRLSLICKYLTNEGKLKCLNLCLNIESDKNLILILRIKYNIKMLHPSINQHLPKIKALFKLHKIKNAYVFGSVLTNKFDEKSDVDFLINFNDYSDPLKVGQSIWDIEDELELITNRKVDLLIERSLKNPYFIQELNNTKQLIYEFAAI